jgi:hypothetical protein
MPLLSDAGVQLVQNLSQRHNVSTGALTHMLIAIQNGNGTMAQFNHAEFGGCGQWMRGGMTMVSDLFNNHLKYRVDSICNDIANELANHQTSPFSGSFQSQSQNGTNSQMQAGGAIGSGNSLFVPDPEANWWPQDMGAPNAVGSQNHVRYAYFANSLRLAVKTGTDVWVYDTGAHQIGGFSQQQGLGGSITFTSQYGTVNLSTLLVISRNGVSQPAPVVPAPVVESTLAPQTPRHVESPDAASCAVNVGQSAASGESVIDTLERLGGLRDKGYITDEEFAAKKAELLNRL